MTQFVPSTVFIHLKLQLAAQSVKLLSQCPSQQIRSLIITYMLAPPGVSPAGLQVFQVYFIDINVVSLFALIT